MEGISAAFYDGAAKVQAAASYAWTTVAEYAGHSWTWLSTNIPAAWNSMCASATAAWAAVQPAAVKFGTWAATYKVEVAVVVGLAVVATLAARAICNRLP